MVLISFQCENANNMERRGKKERSLTLHSQGIPCQSEHGLLAKRSVRDASLTNGAGPSDISLGLEESGDKKCETSQVFGKRKEVKSTVNHP